MGRHRRRYENSNQNTTIRSPASVKVEGTSETSKGVDINNPLVIVPGDKTTKKKISNIINIPKKLNKKERKKLERVLDKKKKQEQRKQLLSDLAKVQIGPSELALMNSVAHIGTKNSRLTSLSKRPVNNPSLKRALEDIDEDLSFKIDQQMTSRKGKRRKVTKKMKPRIEKVESVEEEDEESDQDDEDLNEEEDDEEEEEVKFEQEKKTEKIEIKETIKKQEEKETIQKQEEKETIKKQEEKETKQEEKEKLKEVESKPKIYIHLNRTDEIQQARLNLPIVSEEHTIMEAITENDVVIICGETGSGKTTQVPQFLYEAGYATQGMIGVTEPRRVAAVSMAARVATEMNLSSRQISHQIRYDTNVTPETEIKFMTDGILIREIKGDFLLNKYSVLILDEAHERTANTDLLIGLLSRVVPIRRKKGSPLKLVIMSATLRVEDFTENQKLFQNPPPVIRIDVRQFDVKVHFNIKTPGCHGDNGESQNWAYMKEAYKKVCKIHRQLPAGGILVFVTGRQEVHSLIRKLNATFPKEALKPEAEKSTTKIKLDEYESAPKDHVEDEDLRIPVFDHVSDDEEDGDEGSDLEMNDVDLSTSGNDSTMPLHVLPLYSMLPPARQKLVFNPPPEGTRLCVVATNVAETSLTIPDIKYTVDTGKVKRKFYDQKTGVSSFHVTWISQASANQRAGRAGRTAEGHAYRLYSSAVFSDFDQFEPPEIKQKPIASLVLQMKAMSIDRVVNFPFPTPPSEDSLLASEDLLISLGAITAPDTKGLDRKKMRLAKFSGKISDLGKLMSLFPLHPRFAKMLAVAFQQRKHDDVIHYVIAIVSALTVGELFLNASAIPDGVDAKSKRQQFVSRLAQIKLALCGSGLEGSEKRKLGDLMGMLGAVGVIGMKGKGACYNYCLRPKAMDEVMKLRNQLTNIISCQLDEDLVLSHKMSPPTDTQLKKLRKIVLSAFGDHIAQKAPPCTSEDPKIRKQMKNAYYCNLLTEAVFIHPESCLFKSPQPDYIIFQELSESTSEKTYMKDVCELEASWLCQVLPHLCTFSSPLLEPSPRYDENLAEVVCHVTVSYGRRSWLIGDHEIVYPENMNKYKWFACFFLEGQIFPKMKTFSNLFLSKPTTMVKSWAKLQPRTEALLQELISKQIHQKSKLLEIWKNEPNYLLSAVCEWLPSSSRLSLVESWPPV